MVGGVGGGGGVEEGRKGAIKIVAAEMFTTGAYLSAFYRPLVPIKLVSEFCPLLR